MSAILDAIAESCEEVGECLEWHGRLTTNHNPVIYFDEKDQLVRRAYWSHSNAKPIPAGKHPVPSCGNYRCIGHLVLMSNSDIGKMLARRGAFSSHVRSAKIAEARQRASKLDWDKVRQIRECATALQAAQMFGISKSSAAKIRRYDAWVPKTGFSVFTQL